ncbi:MULTISPECIES: two-component system response regulator BtsR [unclassified Shewanella]|uniref:two-component system response regulator BtsR n=1 Tax=Shewanella TaxID=22 RepID=UPI0021DB5609|nr:MULTISPECIES: two-component system response regulator BtsR [unclassified Shewanella]MCU8021239.1 two-component system response regulator BtsR [Shewanella sp. SM78]MCU8042822.1 two-component system response regulator BtsR [Shewanella sp. SM68]MCU8047196.1 two-component system response regulator BtsR [Shewanella sp. SM65]MCU8078293.1 two-component system response regulator BtsR [Shewanella sp. SM103]
MITCLIVDDELFAREELADLLGQEHDIQIVGQCANAIEALQSITKEKPQLIFLDIQMPRISGMELIAMLDPDDMPKIVFVTAYDEFAVKAFDNHAFDYLLKPIDADRLSKTLTRVRKNLTPQAMDSITPKSLEHIPCYSGNKLKVIAIQDVEYVFSDLSGIHVASTKGKVHTQLTLKVFEEKTPLVRCHRQYLISPKAIAEIELLDTGAEVTTLLGDKVPVSRRYLKSLKQLFGFQ